MRYQVHHVTGNMKFVELLTDSLQEAADMAGVIQYCGGVAEILDLKRGCAIPLGKNVPK